MLGHRLRRLCNINSALGHCLLFAGLVDNRPRGPLIPPSPKSPQGGKVDPSLFPGPASPVLRQIQPHSQIGLVIIIPITAPSATDVRGLKVREIIKFLTRGEVRRA